MGSPECAFFVFFNKWRDSWDGRFNFLSLKIKGLWTPGNRKASCHKGGQPGICNRASPVHMNRRYLLWDCCHLVFPNSQILATMSRTQKITTNLQKVKVAQSCPTLHDSIDYTVHGILQARILEWVTIPFSRRSSQARDLSQVSHIAGGFFLPAEPPGKPKNTETGSLSLLQQIFRTQELNWGLSHHRWNFYQLSNRGSPTTHLQGPIK